MSRNASSIASFYASAVNSILCSNRDWNESFRRKSGLSSRLIQRGKKKNYNENEILETRKLALRLRIEKEYLLLPEK